MITEKYTRKIWILLAESFSSVVSDLAFATVLVAAIGIAVGDADGGANGIIN